MKLELKFKKISAKSIGKSFLMLWDKYHTVVFFVYFLAVVVYGGYYWYKSIYASAWTVEKRETFMKEKDKTVILNEKKLENALAEIGKRNEIYSASTKEIRNIFKLNQN